MIEAASDKKALILGYLANRSPAPGKAILLAVPEIGGDVELRTLLGEMIRAGEIDGETLPLTEDLRERWSFAPASSVAKFYRVSNGCAGEPQPEASELPAEMLADAAGMLADMLSLTNEQPEPAEGPAPAEPAPIKTPSAEEMAPQITSRFFVTSNWKVVVEDDQGRYAELDADEAITLMEFLEGVQNWLEGAP